MSAKSADLSAKPLLHRHCPGCSANNIDQPKSEYSRDHWKLKECASCGFVYLENAVDYDALVADLAWERTYGDERKKRREGRLLRYLFSDATKHLKRFARGGRHHIKVHRYLNRCVTEGNLLDIGCAAGKSLMYLSESMVPFGIEVSKELAARAQELCAKRGGRVVQSMAVTGLDDFNEAFFDAVLMRAYLEHELHPALVLEKTQHILKPGGYLILKVPNFRSVNRKVTGSRWCGFRFPDHVNYFTPETLTRMIEAAGFRVARFGFFDRLPFSDNMWMVVQRPE